VPLIAFAPENRKSWELGTRDSFADLGATVGEVFGIGLKNGTSFLEELWMNRN